MKYLPLVWAGLWRRPMRTALVFLSTVTAFLLFGLLHGMTGAVDALIAGMNANNVVVIAENRRTPLPVSYTAQLASIEGVRAVVSVTPIYAYYQTRSNTIGVSAVGGDFDWVAFTEYTVPPDAAARFSHSRTAALIGRQLALKNGWKVGDRVPLIADYLPHHDGSTTWEVEIAGIYDRPDTPEYANELWLHYEYLDEGRMRGQGTVGSFKLRTVDASQNAQIAAAIDRRFANSAVATMTQSEREWQRSRIRQALDVELMVNAFVSASFFTLLLLTGTSTMDSVRQRIPELAVLKTCGFTDLSVCLLVIVESLLVGLPGALFGLALAAALFPIFGGLAGLRDIPLPTTVVLLGFLIAAIVAIATAALPAARAMRLSVVDALAPRH